VRRDNAMGWQYNKKITGLYAYGAANRYAFVYVSDMGWRQLWPNNDSQVVGMMAIAASAKAKDKYVNFFEEDNKISTMYAW